LGLFAFPEQRVQVKAKRYRVACLVRRYLPLRHLCACVENIWILDLIRKKAFWADANGTYPSPDSILRTKGCELSVDFAPLWFS